MNINITELSEETVYLLKREGFINNENMMITDDEAKLYSAQLDDSVILKAGYHITLDKGGKLFTLYNTEFGIIEIS